MMKKERLYQRVLSIVVLFLISLSSYAQNKVVAYVPNWIDLNSFSSAIDYAKITHINIAFENPYNSAGDLSFNTANNTLINKAHANNIKVLISIGGGSASGDQTLLARYANLTNNTNRAAFVAKLSAYVTAHNFDGLDVDLEGPNINGDYGAFIAALSGALKPKGKLLTSALSQGYGGGSVPNSVFQYFDFVNIMAYDGAGYWDPNSPGQHSSLAFAKSNTQYWLNRGLPKEKAVLGVPFYGYGFGNAFRQRDYPYKEVIANYPGAENVDQVGSTIWYNGIPTIKAKTNYAFDLGIGGIMIWSLDYDGTGSKSLLTAIDQVFKARSVVTPPVPQGPFGSSRIVLPGKLEVENYDVGGQGVAYNDVTASNDGTVYRIDGVDIQATTDTGGGYNLGWTVDGEWLEYSVTVSTTGSYDIAFRTASTSGGAIRMEVDGNDVTGTITLPNTSAWQTWSITTKNNVNLTSGNHIVRLFVVAGGFNLNYVTASLAAPACLPVSASGDDGNVAANVLDNNLTTRWSSNGDGQWLQFCQGTAQVVSGIKIAFFSGDVRKSNFDVQVSQDGLAWTNVLTNVQSSGTSLALESFTFASQNVKFLRILGHGNTVNTWNSYTEVELIHEVIPNQAPVVTLTSPANNASSVAPAIFTIIANASDVDGTVSKVEFYNGTTLLGTSTSAPYSYTWSGIAAGTYTITAKATDNQNAVTTSSAVSVTVIAVVSDCPKLTWSDEFNGTSLDQSKWSYQTGDGCPGNCGWGNSELEYYTNSTNNVSVSGGNLVLTARSQPNYNGTGRNYTSGKLVTAGKFSQKYGRYEAKIKAPSAAGIWPAFWMLADNTNWPSTGEIDILECANANPSTWFGTLHYASTSGAHQSKGATLNTATPLSNDFHVYAVEWNTTQISWFIDGVLRGTTTKAAVIAGGGVWPFDNQKFFIILNVAVGGNFSGQTPNNSQYPVSMLVDYVRVYSGDPCTVTQSPFGGTAALIPGTIEAENYDIGGEGVSYHDTETANQGGAYRTDGVDVQATTDAGGGYNLGYTAAGEWTEYTVNVTATGNYDIAARVATTAAGKSLHVEMNGINISGSIAVPNTGNWQAWQTVTIKNIALTAGQQTMRIVMDTDGFNLNNVKFTASASTPNNQAPVVTLTSPANNASYNAPANVNITASASDVDGTVTKVEFYNGATLLGTDATSPYSYTWSGVAAGTYSITAKATDNAGATTTSSVITVKVNTVVVTDPCSGIAQYAENSGYVAGSKVKNSGKQYQCKPYPYAGWCNGAAWAYGPGTGAYWSDAWTLVGTCSARIGSSDDVATVNETLVTNAPNPFTSSTSIEIAVAEAGDVSVLVYDKTGQVVGSVVEGYLSAGTHTYTFDATNLKNDMYILKMNTNSQVITRKIVKAE